MKTNWLKMYDKFGLILRVETVINSPKEFWVYRTRRHHDGTSSVGYYPMTKSVASLVDYQQQALACNRRYLDALAVVDDPAPAYQQLRQLTEPKVVEGRSYAGFNPARREDVRLFMTVLDGDHIAPWFSQRRHPRTAVRQSKANSPPTTCQCRGGAPPQTFARSPIGGQGAAHATLEGHRTWSPPARLGGSTLPSLLAATRGLAGRYRPLNFSASCREVQGKESKIDVRRRNAAVDEWNALRLPRKPSHHDIAGWAELLVAKRISLGEAHPTLLSNEIANRATIVYLNWREYMRYRSIAVDLSELSSVRAEATWFRRHYPQL